MNVNAHIFSMSDPDLVSIMFPGRATLGTPVLHAQAARIGEVLCMQESRPWRKGSRWAVNGETPMVHCLVPTYPCLSSLSGGIS